MNPSHKIILNSTYVSYKLSPSMIYYACIVNGLRHNNMCFQHPNIDTLCVYSSPLETKTWTGKTEPLSFALHEMCIMKWKSSLPK